MCNVVRFIFSILSFHCGPKLCLRGKHDYKYKFGFEETIINII